MTTDIDNIIYVSAQWQLDLSWVYAARTATNHWTALTSRDALTRYCHQWRHDQT